MNDGPYDYRPPNYRQVVKERSGVFWNLSTSLFGGEAVYSEPIDPQLEKMRRNAEHYRQLNEAAARSRAKAAMPCPVPVVARAEPPRPAPQQMPAVEMTPRATAVAFLERMLADGGQLAQGAIEKEAIKAGIAKKTLRRAKEDLNVKSERKGLKWYWKM